MTSWLAPPAGSGDWVELKQPTALSFSDHLTGTVNPAGTKALVTSAGFGNLTIQLADGRTATVPRSKVNVVRVRGGAEAFRRRSETRSILRISARLVLVMPVALYVLWHLWTYRTPDGILLGLVDAALATALETISLALNQPVAVGVYLLACWVLHKLATLR